LISYKTSLNKYDKELIRIAQLHSGSEDHILLIEGYTDNSGSAKATFYFLNKEQTLY
jgi:outer membrane protein OmpA-like peptidoglycan-associated protein